ncbi:MAG: metallophosphoesterase [Roseovarius sp.]
MKLLDMGELDAPVLLFGGPYSNLHALNAMFEVAQARDIPASHVICTGDVVAYCAHAAQSVARVRAHGCAVVAGNCEKQLAAYWDNCGCGFEAGTTCDLLSAGWYAHASRTLGPEDRAWMGQCPDLIRFRHHGQVYAVLHGGVTDISRFLWSTSFSADFQEEITRIQELVPDTSCIIAGHSGVAFQRQIGDIAWVNAGVIGMPPHDGTPQTEYALLMEGQVSLHRLSYDHIAASDAMHEAGLTQGYHASLLTGHWPSEDVLPPDLRVSSRANG